MNAFLDRSCSVVCPTGRTTSAASNVSSVEIREATPDDAEAVRSVHRESIEGLDREGYTDEQVAAWTKGCESADYAGSIESDETAFVVAEDGRSVVGFGSLRFDSPDAVDAAVDAEVTGVYVHPSAAREGIGSKLYAELESRARVRDVRTLGLTASLNAVPFYESHGYERVGEYRHEFSSRESTGIEGTVVEMTKDL